MLLTILMICAAIAPAIVLAVIIVRRDKFEPEPIGWLLGSAGLGVLAALAVIVALLPFWPDFEVESAGGAFVQAFFGAAIPEECFKFLMLLIVAKYCKKFNEIFDGIIYAVCIGMGFAGLENILYLSGADNWVLTGIMRALVSVPGHYFFAIIMGAFFSLAWFDPYNRRRNFALALALPIAAHGIFDFLLLSAPVLEYGGALMIIAFIVFFKRIRRYAASLVKDRLTLDEARFYNAE